MYNSDTSCDITGAEVQAIQVYQHMTTINLFYDYIIIVSTPKVATGMEVKLKHADRGLEDIG